MKTGEEAAHAHTTLNIFAAIVKILEGGTVYNQSGQRTAARIIAICEQEQQRQLIIYDRERRNG